MSVCIQVFARLIIPLQSNAFRNSTVFFHSKFAAVRFNSPRFQTRVLICSGPQPVGGAKGKRRPGLPQQGLRLRGEIQHQPQWYPRMGFQDRELQGVAQNVRGAGGSGLRQVQPGQQKSRGAHRRERLAPPVSVDNWRRLRQGSD